MLKLTFNKMYASLLIIAVISVLVVPKTVSDGAKRRFQRVFEPVSRPVRMALGPVYSRFHPPPVETQGPRTYAELAEENQQLRLQNASMVAQLQKLQQLNAVREAVGVPADVTRPMKVIGTDPSTIRKSIVLQGSTQDLHLGQAVLHNGGLAGRLDRIGVSGGAQAQLLSDPAFRITAKFGRFTKVDGQMRFEQIGDFTCLLEGDGRQGMTGRNVTLQQAKEVGLAKDDWVVIADSEYPTILQGYRIGQITAIGPARAPLFAQITVQPMANLLTLPEVMMVLLK
jgi:cell shape-determining protein MreC